MLTQIKRWLETPHFDGDEEMTVQARIANTLIIYLGAVLLIVIFILVPLFAFQKIGSWAISIAVFCALAIGRHLVFKGRLQLGGTLIFSVVYLCILAMLILSGGSSGTAMFYFATVVLIAGFFLDARVVNGLTIPTFLIAMGISFLQEQGLVVIPKFFVFNSVFSWIATGIGIVFMIRTRDLFVGNLESALARARQENAARQDAEATLHESGAHYKNLFEKNHAVMLIIDPDSTAIVDANSAACTFYGWSREELLKKRIDEINTLTPAEVHAEVQLARTEKRNHFFFKHRRADGSIRDVEIFSGPLVMAGKTLLYSIIHDITDRKQAETALRESEAKFRAVVENSNNGVIFMSAERKISYVSPAYQQFLGFTPEEMIGHFGPEYIHPEDREFTAQKFRQLLQTPSGTVIIEYRLQRKDGSHGWVETTATNLLDDPNVRSVVLNQRDINERKQVEMHNRVIAEVQDILLHPCELKDIYQLVSEKIKQLIGDGITATAMLDEKRKTLRMGSYHGLDIPFEKAMSLLGFDPWKKEFPLDDMAAEDLSIYRRSNLEILEGGLYALMTRLVPEPACLMIEKLLGVQKIYGMGFIHKNEHLGGLAILARNDITPHIAAIEQIVNLATIAIERKRAEESLAEQSKFTSAVVDTAPVLVYVYDMDTNSNVYSNDGLEQILGYSPDQVKEMGAELFSRLIHPDDLPTVIAFQSKIVAAADQEVLEIEYRMCDVHGQWVNIRSYESPFLRHKDGSLKQKIGVSIDITARMHAEEALRASEALLRAMADNYPNSYISIIEKDLTVGYTAGQEFKKLNLDPNQFVGLTLEQVFGEHAPLVRENYLKTFGGVETQFELFINNQHQLYRTVPLMDQAGRITRILAVVENITERKRAEEALRASEERYKLMFDSAPLAINITRGTEIIYANPNYLKMFGFSSLDELRSVAPLELFTPKCRPQILENVQRRAQGLSVPDNYEAECFRKDGTRFPILMYLTRMTFADGPATVGFILNITARKRAEEALKASKEMLQSIFASSPDSITVADVNGVIKLCNQSAAEVHGYSSAEELIGINFIELVAEEDRPRAMAGMMQVMTHGVVKDAPFTGLKCNGEKFVGELSVSAMKDNSGSLSGFVGITKDVTERKHAEEELLKFKLGLERSADAIFITDPQGVIVYANPSFEKIYGYTQSDAIGHTPRILKSGVVTMEQYQGFWAMLLNKDIVSGEIINKTKDGRLLTIEGSNNPILDAAGNIVGFLGVHRDITARKQAEEKIRQQLEELQRWYDITIERETRTVELKHEVNELLRRLNESPRYASTDSAE